MDKAVKVIWNYFYQHSACVVRVPIFFLSLLSLSQRHWSKLIYFASKIRVSQNVVKSKLNRNRLKYLFTDLNSTFNSKKNVSCIAIRIYRIQKKKTKKNISRNYSKYENILYFFQIRLLFYRIIHYIINRATIFLLLFYISCIQNTFKLYNFNVSRIFLLDQHFN